MSGFWLCVLCNVMLYDGRNIIYYGLCIEGHIDTFVNAAFYAQTIAYSICPLSTDINLIDQCRFHLNQVNPSKGISNVV